jgi:Beta-ketoacyl synthase, N-terminal domain
MSPALPPVAIEGIAFWATQLPGWDIARGVIRGEQIAPSAAAARPAATLLPPTERRRAPDTVALALEVGARACEAAGRAPAELPSVFASTHGDLAISDYMCTTLVNTPTLLSPTKFHNSVHNAAAGYWSIGTHSYLPYTAISASRYTFASGLLEAVTQATCGGAPVLYVAFDIEAKGALATMAPSSGLLGVALVLARARQEVRCRLDLQVAATDAVRMTPARSPAAELVGGNALAPCLPFFEALAHEVPAVVTLALGERLVLEARVQ